MLPVYRAAQVRELDRRAIHEFAIPGITLMGRAGEAVFRALGKSWSSARRIAVVCGLGNNAGDGYVVARLVRSVRPETHVYQVGNPERLTGDAATAYHEFLESLTELGRGSAISEFSPGCLDHADLVVDALLGTGLTGAVRAPFHAAIAEINNCGAPVLAVDIPSGLCADSGRPLGIAVRARQTITFVGRKLGLFIGEGPEYAGEVIFDDLKIPAEVYETVPPVAYCLDIDALIRKWPSSPRRRTAHKGDFGHVLVIGGAPGYAGAGLLAAEGALRVGAGLVTLATHPAHAAGIGAQRPEIMVHAVASGADLTPLLARATVVVIGPGLGRTPWSRELWNIARALRVPIVFDADALNFLAEFPPPAPSSSTNEIYTPHPGEAGRLLGCSPAAVQSDRCAALESLIRRYGGTWVLKGAGTLIGDQTPPSICPVANPGMASGGMGDVLAGIIGGLLAQQLPPFAAATLGVSLHAMAGLMAARDGERGLIASDLFPFIRGLASGYINSFGVHC